MPTSIPTHFSGFSGFAVEQLEDAVLHPAEGVFFVLIHPLEDVAFREELRRADEESLFNEKVTRFLLGDADQVGHDVGDQAELLDAVVPLATDVDHPEGVSVLPAIESINHEIQPADRFPVVVAQDEVRTFIFVDGSQFAQGMEDLLVVRQRNLFVVELVLRTREDFLGDGRLIVGHIRPLSAPCDMVYGVNYQLNQVWFTPKYFTQG